MISVIVITMKIYGDLFARSRGVLAAATAAACAVAIGLASPAAANVSEGYVVGAGAVGNDWDDEGPLSTTQNRIGGAVWLWQEVLYASGQLTWDQIDCEFGPTTKAATERFQAAHGLTRDGVAGPKTFAAAGNYLTISDNWVRFKYPNINREGQWYRNPSSGRYLVLNTYPTKYGAISNCGT